MIPSDTAQQEKSFEVLLVEDNSGDVILIQESLKDSEVKVNLRVVKDGVEAVDYFSKRPPFSQASRPDLILLDINLPKKGGLEVLQEIRSHPDLKSVPVVVLTTSHSDKDILKSYGLGADCFVTKPIGFHEYMASIRSIIKNFLR